MAQFRSKSSEKLRSRQVWGQRPGQPGHIQGVQKDVYMRTRLLSAGLYELSM